MAGTSIDMSKVQIFEGFKVRTVWDDDAQEWFFSVVDVVAVLADSADPKQYIKKMRARDPELNTRWYNLYPYSNDGLGW